jgi:UPF0271 protein
MRLWLNSDVGERPEALRDGSEEQLLGLLDWANIACGGHAGDEKSMEQVVSLCRKHGVQVGAHPGYPDRVRFGREPLDLPAEAIAQTVHDQVRLLDAVARGHGLEVWHVKPHGALYNQAARNPAVALAIAEGVSRWRREVVLVGLAGSVALRVWREAGFAVAAEIFADRRYEPDGSLRSRQYPDALITDPEEAAGQVQRFEGGDTVCVHSDTPHALAIARAVRDVLS